MDLIEKYLGESEALFWNTLMNRISKEFKGYQMMMRSRKDGTTAVLPVNSFHPLPKELISKVKSIIKSPSSQSEISDKAIILTTNEWKEYFKEI
jgi:hypothetical protein